MKSKVTALALLASTSIFGYSTTSLAEEICYAVGGSLTTENVTSTLQIGDINLTLTDASGNQVFSEAGSLVGNITGANNTGATFLSHKARFSQGDSFVTEGDVAQIVGYPLDYDDNEMPCAFPIYETITDISKGTRFFKGVTSVNVVAVGSVYNCPVLNENSFVLDGTLCVER